MKIINSAEEALAHSKAFPRTGWEAAIVLPFTLDWEGYLDYVLVEATPMLLASHGEYHDSQGIEALTGLRFPEGHIYQIECA